MVVSKSAIEKIWECRALQLLARQTYCKDRKAATVHVHGA